MKPLAIIIAVSLLSALAAPAATANDWPAWRGPTLNGVAHAGQVPPTTFSETTNVKWKTPIPGRGHSSPIIVGQRIILTTADKQRPTVPKRLQLDRWNGISV